MSEEVKALQVQLASLEEELSRVRAENQTLSDKAINQDAVIRALCAGTEAMRGLDSFRKFTADIRNQLLDHNLSLNVLIRMIVERGLFSHDEFQAEGQKEFETMNNKMKEKVEEANEKRG